MLSLKHLTASLLLATSFAFPVLAQVPAGGMGGGPGGGAGMFNPAAIRGMMTNRIKDQAGFSDEEWSVVEPKLWKLLGLQIDAGQGIGSMIRGFGRGRGGPGGAGGPVAAGGFNLTLMLSSMFHDGTPSPAAVKHQELQTAVDDPETPNTVLATKLEEYRQAVKKAREELTTTQEDLRSVLTLRQEASLMQMGLLD